MKATTFHPAYILLLLLLLADNLTALLPKQAGPDTPWEDLKAVLSDPSILTPTSTTAWKEECVDIFQAVTQIEGVDGSFPTVTNYLLMEQPSGLCLDHVSCVFENCSWPPATWPTFPSNVSPYVIFDNTNMMIDTDAMPIPLPAMVLQPKAAADIVRAVEFCQQHDIGITVKVAGHSYFGASSAHNTLLVKMNPNYPKYAIEGSLVECTNATATQDNSKNSTIPTANKMACALATARAKPAVLRVGGGELFDEAYRSVSFDWNEANPEKKYHLVGGGAGTVSAAGGWMASGGLSGTTGMRMFGVGIDQVVALELILPSGRHVRLAPTEWEPKPEGQEGYPTTTKVTGYCNQKPYETDESLWEWAECDDDIDFNEMWFAVRGGGGGTYGIVVSLHYQLHAYPGALTYVISGQGNLTVENIGTLIANEEAAYYFTTQYIEFVLTFMYLPEAMNVSQADSRACNSAQTWNLNPFLGGLAFCYGSGGSTLIEKWKEFIMEPTRVSALQGLGLDDAIIAAFTTIFNGDLVAESYAEATRDVGLLDPGIPDGRLADDPKASIVPILGGFPNLQDSFHTHFPTAVIQADVAGLSQLLALDVLTTGGGAIYAMGGFIPAADDGLNSLSPTRRSAGFLMSVTNAELRDTYYSFFFAGLDPDKDDFPGSSCHNHAMVQEMGPVKTNWTQSCPVSWPQTERDQKCVSQNEAAWGTANMKRLETFKASIDPNGLFICTSGIGYSRTSEDEDGGTQMPSTSSSSVVGGSVPIYVAAVSSVVSWVW